MKDSRPEVFGDVRSNGSDEESLNSDKSESEIDVHPPFVASSDLVEISSSEKLVESSLESVLVHSPISGWVS